MLEIKLLFTVYFIINKFNKCSESTTIRGSPHTLSVTIPEFPTSIPKSLMSNSKAIDNPEEPMLEPLESVKASKEHKKSPINSQNR